MLRSVASGDCGLLYVGFDVLGVVVFVPDLVVVVVIPHTLLFEVIIILFLKK